MTTAVKSEIDKIVSKIVETGIVTKIILFGSCARGEEGPDSDIDLCVLTPVRDDEDGERLTNVNVNLRLKVMRIRERPLDLITYNQDDFSEWVKRPKSFERHIVENGVVLYE